MTATVPQIGSHAYTSVPETVIRRAVCSPPPLRSRKSGQPYVRAGAIGRRTGGGSSPASWRVSA